MKPYKIVLVGGVRPNFVKLAALYHAFSAYKEFEVLIVHTGQHNAVEMSELFFNELGLPSPNYTFHLTTGSTSVITAQIITHLEKVLKQELPHLVIVTGDVTSTLACAIVSTQMRIPLAHVEAGLRSGDRSMPEEINRIVTDQLSDLLFVSEPVAIDNLIKENRSKNQIHYVGNVMIDTLVQQMKLVDRAPYSEPYLLVTMHRPSNVDSYEHCQRIVKLVQKLAERQKVIFPVHPRTNQKLSHFGLLKYLQEQAAIVLLPPQSYRNFLALMMDAMAVITDSGGVQEETSYLAIPCLTFRSTTERPITVENGTNYLLDDLQVDRVMRCLEDINEGKKKIASLPALWDGNASQRIVEIVLQFLTEKY